MKGSSLSESGTDFHSALGEASAANRTSSSAGRQLIPKQTQNGKSTATVVKKKDIASDSTVSDNPAPLPLPAKPLLENLLNPVAIALPLNSDIPTNASSESANSLQGIPEKDAATLNQNITQSFASNIDLINTSATQHTAIAAEIAPDPVPVTATPSVGNTNSKTVDAPPPDGSFKVSGTTKSTPPGDTSDKTALAAQQAAAAVAQSVASSVTVPTLSSIGEIQSASEIQTGSIPNLNRIADPGKAPTSRQTTSVPSTAKPASSSSDVRSKAASGKEGDAQAFTPPATGGPLVKVAEPPAAIGHAATEFRATFDSSILQAVAQAPQPDGLATVGQTALTAKPSPESTTQAAPVQTSTDPQAMPSITGAQLTQSMRSSEMKLGLQSTEFGNISISTSLNHQAISAQISIDHAELGRALAIHLPAIEEKLGSAYGVQAKVELRESSNPSSSNESGYSNSGQQSREQRKSEYGGSASTQGATLDRVANRASSSATSVFASGSRLDIRI